MHPVVFELKKVQMRQLRIKGLGHYHQSSIFGCQMLSAVVACAPIHSRCATGPLADYTQP